MHPPLRIQLRGRQRARLEQMYREADDPRTQLRVQMVLLAQAGYSVLEIGQIVSLHAIIGQASSAKLLKRYFS